jgi:thymidylate synthase
VVNPLGDVGVVTLWSDPVKVRRRFEEAGSAAFDPDAGRVAVIANLYGNGMYAMFCNLLHNPQIRHLVAVGLDRGLPTCAEIEAFLAVGTEDDVVLGVPVQRVRGTGRIFPAHEAFAEARLRDSLTFRFLGRADRGVVERFSTYLDDLPVPDAPAPAGAPDAERITVPLELSIGEDHVHRPSELHAHQVVRRRPISCWKELVTRVVRFGHPVTLGSGEQRLELLNAKVVITEPAREPADVLRAYGFDLEDLLAYEAAMLRDDPPEGDIAYTYGNRLFGYFDQGDGSTRALDSIVSHLEVNPESRQAYLSLWDTAHDLPPGRVRAAPCLATLHFRRSGGRLTMSATYRVHNLLSAWLKNAYGLMAVQRHVAERVGMEPGALTIVSHSLGINPAEPGYERARALADAWVTDEDFDEETRTSSLPEDPNGTFVVSVDLDTRQLIAEHWAREGLMLKRYVGTRADRLAREIIGDMAVSLPSHAMWLGGELARNEALLTGEQASSPPGGPAASGRSVIVDAPSAVEG